MMAGNPNWWNMNIPPQQQPSSSPPPFLSSPPVPLFQYPHQYVFGSSPNSLPLTTLVDYTTQELPQSWSQFLLGGVSGEEDTYKFSASHFPTRKLLGNWEEQTILNNSSHVKQEVFPHSSKPFGQQYGSGSEELYPDRAHSNTPPYTNINAWSNMMPVSSPTSCVTTLSSNTNNNLLDFSNSISKKVDRNQGCTKNPQNPDPSSTECKSTATGGACKKARVQASSTQSPLKVRKEKLGDRITALHQLVSPFGKTDTASVLLEAIGYIRFLQGQIEALSSPYLSNESGNLKNPPSENEEDDDIPKDLRSRGLCLVPVSGTLQVGHDISGADYWTPAPFNSGF